MMSPKILIIGILHRILYLLHLLVRIIVSVVNFASIILMSSGLYKTTMHGREFYSPIIVLFSLIFLKKI